MRSKRSRLSRAHGVLENSWGKISRGGCAPATTGSSTKLSTKPSRSPSFELHIGARYITADGTRKRNGLRARKRQCRGKLLLYKVPHLNGYTDIGVASEQADKTSRSRALERARRWFLVHFGEQLETATKCVFVHPQEHLGDVLDFSQCVSVQAPRRTPEVSGSGSPTGRCRREIPPVGWHQSAPGEQELPTAARRRGYVCACHRVEPKLRL